MAIETNQNVQDLALQLQAYAEAIKGEHPDLAQDIKDMDPSKWQAEFGQHGAVDLTSLEEAAKLAKQLDAPGKDSFTIDDSAASTKDLREGLKGARHDSRTAQHAAARQRFGESVKGLPQRIGDAFRPKDPEAAVRREARREESGARHTARLQQKEQNRFDDAQIKAAKQMGELHGKLAAQVARDLESREGVDVKKISLGADGAPDVFEGVYNVNGREVAFSFAVAPGAEENLYAQFDSMQEGLAISDQIISCHYSTGGDLADLYCYSDGTNNFRMSDPSDADGRSALAKAMGFFPAGQTARNDSSVKFDGYYMYEDGVLSIGCDSDEMPWIDVALTEGMSIEQAQAALLEGAGLGAPPAPNYDAAQVDAAIADVKEPAKAAGALELLAQAYQQDDLEPRTKEAIYKAVYAALSSSATGGLKIENEKAAIEALGMIDRDEAVKTLARIASKSENPQYKEAAAKSLGNLAGGDSSVIDAAQAAIAKLPTKPTDLQALANAEIPATASPVAEV